MKWYFRDNFFSAGRTDIVDAQENVVGVLDLKTAFNSSVDVYDDSGALKCSGAFPFFSNKWEVTGPRGDERGVLKTRMSFFTKKYEYTTTQGECYEITSPAFSRSYEIHDEDGTLVASFEQVSGWVWPSAFCLENFSNRLDSYELVAVIMGMHNIQKRQQAAAVT
ncbi:hypothetical protein G3578_13480 [Brevibacillus sp. SYP-B805]|uniref:hypothetical protein n=1 Tax=Brevibacillus sp. SYP-B805 TaxID=1578199 RepID=UPI0013E9BD7B|nr:hypothetical protein [Brevibacillus sp. SYP-B805]NGQ96172.1 hypothetical protein [Brevibacillus sp. SYP-B805]